VGARRCFELFGYDFLLDFQGRAWLLEVNCSPALKPHNGDPWFSEVVQRLQKDIMEVAVGGPSFPMAVAQQKRLTVVYPWVIYW
jgi:D-alanine-D-alanine ligase-like ATP-grasp enzyme